MKHAEETILFSTATMVQEHDVPVLSSDDQRLSIATESGGASIQPENILKDREVGHSNEHTAVACSVCPIIEPTGDQEMSSEDVSFNPQSNSTDYVEVLNYWKNATSVLESEQTLIETIQENLPSTYQASPGDEIDHQAIDDLFLSDEWSGTPGMECSPDSVPRKLLAEHEDQIGVPDVATDLLNETRNSPTVCDHHILFKNTSSEAILESTEQMGISNSTARGSTDPNDIEGFITEDMTHSCGETAGTTADQHPRAGSHRVLFRTSLTVPTNAGEPTTDSIDLTSNIEMDQNPRAGSSPYARSSRPIIVDTNNGEPILIEDSSDSSDVSEFSDSSDIASDPRTWAGSQHHVRYRPLRVLKGMVRWSDENLAIGNRTIVQDLWIDAQRYWESMRTLKCLAKSKLLKKFNKFNKMMANAKERTKQNGGTVRTEDAAKLQSKFKDILPRLQRRMHSSKERDLVASMGRTLKDLEKVVEITVVITEQLPDEGDEDDDVYKPRGAARNL